MTRLFAKRIRELRERIGRTQEEIADMLEIRRQTYNAYEQGAIMPKSENLIKISQILNTSPNYLLGWDEIEKKDARAAMVASSGVIRRLREERNLTLLELSEEFNIPLKTLTEYENGTREIPKSVLVSFAEYFNVDIGSIIALELESTRKHTVVTTSRVLEERYRKWQKEVGYNHFTDEEIDEITSYAKYIKWRRKENRKGGG